MNKSLANVSKWARKGQWWIESDCGCRISKAIVDGRPIYTAWRQAPSENPYARVGYAAVVHTECLDEAKQNLEERS